MEAHHGEIGAVSDANANFPGLAEADHGETYDGELAEGAECFDDCAQALNFRHGEWDAAGADTRRALLDVNEAVLVAVDERLEKHAAHQAEDRGVRADSQGQREYHGDFQPFAARERTGCESYVLKGGQARLAAWRFFRMAPVHRGSSFDCAAM